jgi:hypothetical protein
MNNIPMLRSYIHRVESILSELNSNELNPIDLPDIISKLSLLKEHFEELSEITNNGKGPSQLNAKLKILNKLLVSYSKDKDEFLINNLAKKYKNKNVSIDTSTLEKYILYSEYTVKYMQELGSRYKQTKNIVTPLFKLHSKLTGVANLFELQEEDLPSFDNLSVDDLTSSVEEASPAKTINSIRSLLRIFGKFIKTVEDKYQKMDSLLNEGAERGVDTLEELYSKINYKNKLIQSLFNNLLNVKNIISESNYQHKLAFIAEYKKLLKLCIKYLPQKMMQRFLNDPMLRETSQVDEELARSVGKIRNYDPSKDPMMFPNSNKKSVVKEPPAILQQRTRIPTPELDLPLEKEEIIGDPISSEDKKKYEALWNAASLKRLNKLAQIFNTKYNL